MCHKDLQALVTTLQTEVSELEVKKSSQEKARKLEILCVQCRKNGMANGDLSDPNTADDLVRRYIMHEFSVVLNHRRELESPVAEFEPQLTSLEESITLGRKAHEARILQQQQQQAKVTPIPSPRPKKPLKRTRSVDWPEIPDVGKIHEENPEVLAKNILETGRQIEANKVSHKMSGVPNGVISSGGSEKSWKGKLSHSQNHSQSQHQGQNHNQSQAHCQPQPQNQLPKAPLSFVSSSSNSTPKVSFYEDGVKSIITNLFNEDRPNPTQPQPLTSPQLPSSSTPNKNSPHVNNVRARTPPRSNLSQQVSIDARNRKKMMQFSPEVTNSYGKASPGKLALLAHLMPSSHGREPTPERSNERQDQHQPHQRPRTIQDFSHQISRQESFWRD